MSYSPQAVAIPARSGDDKAVWALIALVVSRRITRLGRPATLRWAEQG